jgi:hypothetical protein
LVVVVAEPAVTVAPEMAALVDAFLTVPVRVPFVLVVDFERLKFRVVVWPEVTLAVEVLPE